MRVHQPILQRKQDEKRAAERAAEIEERKKQVGEQKAELMQLCQAHRCNCKDLPRSAEKCWFHDGY